MKSSRRILLSAVTAVGLWAGQVCGAQAEAGSGTQAALPHFADADNLQSVRAGRELYRERCARCHGRRLEGQALWRLQDRFAHQRAPAHDETGHTWAHSDEELFRITRSGRLPNMPEDATSYMPAFAQILRDDEILQVIAYIKARWSKGIRISQATLNPGYAGMPVGAEGLEWTLPPNCSGTLQNWRTAEVAEDHRTAAGIR